MCIFYWGGSITCNCLLIFQNLDYLPVGCFSFGTLKQVSCNGMPYFDELICSSFPYSVIQNLVVFSQPPETILQTCVPEIVVISQHTHFLDVGRTVSCASCPNGAWMLIYWRSGFTFSLLIKWPTTKNHLKGDIFITCPAFGFRLHQIFIFTYINLDGTAEIRLDFSLIYSFQMTFRIKKQHSVLH